MKGSVKGAPTVQGAPTARGRTSACRTSVGVRRRGMSAHHPQVRAGRRCFSRLRRPRRHPKRVSCTATPAPRLTACPPPASACLSHLCSPRSSYCCPLPPARGWHPLWHPPWGRRARLLRLRKTPPSLDQTDSSKTSARRVVAVRARRGRRGQRCRSEKRVGDPCFVSRGGRCMVQRYM